MFRVQGCTVLDSHSLDAVGLHTVQAGLNKEPEPSARKVYKITARNTGKNQGNSKRLPHLSRNRTSSIVDCVSWNRTGYADF